MSGTWWEQGQYDAICDVCGFSFKSGKLKKRYDGMMVCAEDWEARHPLERTVSIRSPATLPWTRPEPADTFIEANFCTPEGRQGVAGYGEAGCAILELDIGLRG